MLKTWLLLLVGVSVLGGSVEGNGNPLKPSKIEFITNVTVENPEHFDFRVAEFFIDGNVANYRSTSLNGTDGEGTANMIVGSCYAPPLGALKPSPTAWLAYYSSDVQVNPDQIDYDSTVDGARGYVATIYTLLEELDSSNSSVKSMWLSDKTFTLSNYNTSGDGEELKWVSFTSEEDNYSLTLTFVVSNVIGVVTGNATITPKSMESYVEISGYPYSSPENHLRLTFYLASRSFKSSKTYEESQTVIAGEKEDQIHFHLNSNAIVDGEVVELQVQGLKEKNVPVSKTKNPFIQSQLRGGGSQKAEMREITVDFPANADEIFYDPAMGFNAPNSSSFLAPSFSLLVLSLFSFFFFF